MGKKTTDFANRMQDAKEKYDEILKKYESHYEKEGKEFQLENYEDAHPENKMREQVVRLARLRELLIKDTTWFEDYIKKKKIALKLNPFKGKKSLDEADLAIQKAKNMIGYLKDIENAGPWPSL